MSEAIKVEAHEFVPHGEENFCGLSLLKETYPRLRRCGQRRESPIHRLVSDTSTNSELRDAIIDKAITKIRKPPTDTEDVVPEREESDEEYEERTRPRIVNPPERIWLQTGCDDEVGEIDWEELARNEVSWCWERIDKTDIEYVLASTASGLAEALQEAQATIESMRSENRLHGHITDASAHYLHKSKPLIDAALARWEGEGQS